MCLLLPTYCLRICLRSLTYACIFGVPYESTRPDWTCSITTQQDTDTQGFPCVPERMRAYPCVPLRLLLLQQTNCLRERAYFGYARIRGHLRIVCDPDLKLHFFGLEWNPAPSSWTVTTATNSSDRSELDTNVKRSVSEWLRIWAGNLTFSNLFANFKDKHLRPRNVHRDCQPNIRTPPIRSDKRADCGRRYGRFCVTAALTIYTTRMN